MSKKEKATEKPEQKEEKIVTRYDRRMQKRREQEEKEKREKKIGMIIGVVVVAALVCLVASFPIRTYLAVNESYVTVDGEKVTRVEFDYNYNIAKNSYMSQYGSYMSYFGVDMSGDLSAQMYSDTLTWKDYFDQMAVENIEKNKAMLREAKAAGFTYDTKEEYESYEASLKEQASAAGTGLNSFLKEQFGPYATMSRLSGYVKDGMVVNAYYEKVMEDKTPSDEEIENYYEENKDTYDSVDYRLETVNAVLPTEPTGLADPEAGAEGTDGAEAGNAEGEDGDGSASGEGAADGAEEAPYEPSEAEIAAAMEEARTEADNIVKTIASSGELMEGQTSAQVTSVIRDWLFDASRKQGDSAVLEDSAANRYYVVAFEKRYRDETPSADVRVVISQTTDAQTILDEWKNGEATEDSFAELCNKYSEDAAGKANGGLYEAVTDSNMEEELSEWMFAEGRANGDATAVTTAEGTNYVVYYIGQNDPEWKLGIKSTLVGEAMTQYLEDITADMEVVDSKGRLNYLKVQEQEEAEASSQAESGEGGQDGEGAEASQESGTESSAESTQQESTQQESPDASGENAQQ